MTAFCGRTICNILSPDGTEKLALFNGAIEETAEVSYFDRKGATKYKMPLTINEKQSGCRALHYSRYMDNQQMEPVKRIVPFVDPHLQVSQQDQGAVNPDAPWQPLFKTVSPLYETIGLSLLDLEGSQNSNISFWTNHVDGSIPIDSHGKHVYRSENIYKFDENNLEDTDLEASSTRMLCSALVGWDILKTSGSMVADMDCKWTPVIFSVNILMVQTDGLIVDFSTGSGGGGGIGRHNHSNNDQGGLAYAVFAPGTTLAPINWS